MYNPNLLLCTLHIDRPVYICHIYSRSHWFWVTEHETRFEICNLWWIKWLYLHYFKYNQQDTTLYNILYYCQCSTCFWRFILPSSGTQKLYTASGIGQACLLLPLVVAASKLGIYQMLCVQFLSSWWWEDKPPETCRALAIIKNIV